jgi:hypothetical protein
MNNTPTHLNNDRGHYRALFVNLRYRIKELMNTEYDMCYAFGGGLPKLEVGLKIKKIQVIDGIANIYQKHLKQFRQLYKFPGEIEFVQLIFNAQTISRFTTNPQDKVLFTFTHFLEHLSLEEHLNVLKNLPKNTDILIYGPNVERAQSLDWVHFRGRDHNTFIPFTRFKKLIEEFGYKMIHSITYSDDLFLYFNTGDK